MQRSSPTSEPADDEEFHKEDANEAADKAAIQQEILTRGAMMQHYCITISP